MNLNFTTTIPHLDTATKKILVVGFDHYSYILMNENTEEDFGYYKFEKINNSFKAYKWLERELQLHPNEPIAVVCNYQFLRDDNFILLKNIQLHTQLKAIPFVLITDEEFFDIDRKEAIKMGIDDCYTEPVNWNDLRHRLEFLFTFKPQIITAKQSKNEDLSFKMPLGKRAFDIVFASTVLLFISPVLLAIALAIRFSSKGPVIYKSKRIGSGYKEFDFLKFRSMVQDADELRDKLAHLNNYNSEDGAGAFLKIKGDPRITSIGKFIRKTSLDELPQLWNVIRGDMSIVGNRPLPLDEAMAVTKDEWSRRFHAPAGITGLWQTVPSGKDTMSVEERIKLDVEYAEKFSFGMDAKIISRTLPAMIQKGE